MEIRSTGVLAGYLSEPEMAAELGRTTRTLARWRHMRIGPPFIMNGREIKYSIDGARDWLKAGGTAAAAKRGRRK